MNSQHPGRRQRRSRGGSRRSGDRRPRQNQNQHQPAARAPKKTFWQRLMASLFGNGQASHKPSSRNGSQREPQPQSQTPAASASARVQRKPESVEVTSPRLYVGNLSFDATESDLFELFNGVGHVQNAEVVSYRHNQRSKGFAFVQMQTVDEAKRAVAELHDKEFLGRKLVVSGAKSSEQQPPRE
jgi:RNA recognition motif-containing protein